MSPMPRAAPATRSIKNQAKSPPTNAKVTPSRATHFKQPASITDSTPKALTSDSGAFVSGFSIINAIIHKIPLPASAPPRLFTPLNSSLQSVARTLYHAHWLAQ